MPFSPRYSPDPRITKLGDAFYDVVTPAHFPKHELRFRNDRWAEKIGFGDLDSDEWTSHFAKFDPLPNNLEAPLALRYHGHQFDVYNPSLGDGRGFLFAQLRDEDDRLLDLGTKGSGTTPWSRGGDGRLTLKGGVREVLATEMLEAHGVYTSKSLSLIETGEKLMRGDEPSPTRSSALVRLSHSHIRIGTFQRLSYTRDLEALDRLLTYSIENYFPHLLHVPDRVSRFLSAVSEASAKMVAGWMVAGFVHGVLNSDNMMITGESFDYGPYRFLPTYDTEFVAAYFDHAGLYAFGQQPRAVFRNLTRLADALRILHPELPLASALGNFENVLQEELAKKVLRRLGIMTNGEIDSELVVRTYAFLENSGIGYDAFFFEMYGGRDHAISAKNSHFCQGREFESLREILDLYSPSRHSRPSYFDRENPCTLLIQEIESIWKSIDLRDDWDPFHAKIQEIRSMGDTL